MSGNYKILYNDDASVKAVIYSNSGYTCAYSDGAYETVKDSEKVTVDKVEYAKQEARTVGATTIPKS